MGSRSICVFLMTKKRGNWEVNYKRPECEKNINNNKERKVGWFEMRAYLKRLSSELVTNSRVQMAKRRHTGKSNDVSCTTLEDRVSGGISTDDQNLAIELENYRQLKLTLDNFKNDQGKPLRREPYQVRFHEAMIRGSLPHIFRRSWPTKSKEILANLDIKDGNPKQLIAISSPRQVGKSTSVAMFCAAVLVACPAVKVLVFAQNKRGSGNLLKMTKAFYAQRDPERLRIATENQENFVVADTKDPTDPLVTELISLPGTSEGTRGQFGHIIILEEAGFMKNLLFKATVVPLLMNEGRTLICISTTPTNVAQFYWGLFDTKDEDTGEYYFERIQIRRTCDDCAEKGLNDCPHVKKEAPSWQTNKRKKMVEAIYGDDKTMYNREIGGAFAVDDMYVFKKKAVDALEKKPRIDGRHFTSPMAVFVGVDPSGGGRSDSASIAFTFDFQDRLIILDVASVHLKELILTPENDMLSIQRHELSRRSRDLANAKWIYIIEANDKIRAHGIAMYLLAYWPGPNTAVMKEDTEYSHGTEPKYGITMTSIVKNAIAMQLNTFLLTDGIYIWEDIPSDKATIATFFKQMRQYQKMVKVGSDPVFTKDKVEYSGKASGPDDMIMAFQFGVYYALHWFLTSARKEFAGGTRHIGFGKRVY